MDTVDVGETYPLVSQWWDADQQPAEPSTITLVLDRPDATSSTYAKGDMTSLATGTEVKDTWEYDVAATVEGMWRWRFDAVVAGAHVIQSGGFLVGAAGDPPGPFEQWCGWADVERLHPAVDLSGVLPAARDSLIDRGTWILYMLDGRRYPGIGEATRRLCSSCSSCRGSCRCDVRSTVDLGGRWPVLGVWDVVVRGVTLPPTAYTVRGRRWLDRIDGDPWPSCSNLDDPDSFHVSWAYGLKPPVGLKDACAFFAGELALSSLGQKCRIPDRVTSISREGVSYTILDSMKFLDAGRTGLYEVDLELGAAKMGRRLPPGGFVPYGHGTRARFG